MKPPLVSRRRAVCKLGALAIACLALLAVAPAVAGATTVYVSNSPAKAPFNSCGAPGYNSIQEAIGVNAPATTIHICNGTYPEQLKIEKAVTLAGESSAAVVKYPASPAAASTSCQFAHPGQTEQPVIEICGAVTVKITGLTVNAESQAGSCAPELFGVIAGGNATLAMIGANVVGPTVPAGLEGCQTGVGIQVGRKAAGQAASATLSKVEVSAYNKNGITVDGPGSKATIKGTTVSHTPSSATANNGIQISRGAVGKVIESNISGNECNLSGACGENGLLEAQATGVLMFEAASGTSVTKSTIARNDIGVYTSSGQETTKPQMSVTGNTLEEDRYEGVLLDQGYATVNKNAITGPGNVGIELIQYEGQAFGPRGTGSEDTVSGMSVHAVEGLSDNAAADQFGSFKITKSTISNNPLGATVPQSVFTNNPSKLPILTTGSDN